MLPILLLLGVGGGVAYAMSQSAEPNIMKDDSARWLKNNAGNMLATPEMARRAAVHLRNLGMPMMALLAEGGVDVDDLRVDAPWAIERLKKERKTLRMMTGL